jgi:hypothetical protein
MLIVRYKLGESSICKVLSYTALERRRLSRKGPKFLLTEAKVDEIILYLGQLWETRKMDWGKLREELQLGCSINTLKRRLNARGYCRGIEWMCC